MGGPGPISFLEYVALGVRLFGDPDPEKSGGLEERKE